MLADEMGIEAGPRAARHGTGRAVTRPEPRRADPARTGGTGCALPGRATPFVGRALRLDSLERIVRSGRLVTIIGPAGAGKTRVAVELVRRAFS